MAGAVLALCASETTGREACCSPCRATSSRPCGTLAERLICVGIGVEEAGRMVAAIQMTIRHERMETWMDPLRLSQLSTSPMLRCWTQQAQVVAAKEVHRLWPSLTS